MSAKIDKEKEYARRDELVTGLRELADLFEKNGVDKLPLPDSKIIVSLNAQVWEPDPQPNEPWRQKVNPEKSKALLKRIVRGMGAGRKEKEYSDQSFVCRKHFSEEVQLMVRVDREVACRPVKTGRTIVHPARVESYKVPERVEEEVEWICDDTLLGGKKEAA